MQSGTLTHKTLLMLLEPEVLALDQLHLQPFSLMRHLPPQQTLSKELVTRLQVGVMALIHLQQVPDTQALA
jgi:hypothetical protein